MVVHGAVDIEPGIEHMLQCLARRAVAEGGEKEVRFTDPRRHAIDPLVDVVINFIGDAARAPEAVHARVVRIAVAGKAPAVGAQRVGDFFDLGLVCGIVITRVAERSLKPGERDRSLVPVPREVRVLGHKCIHNAHHIAVCDDVHAAGGVRHLVEQRTGIIDEKPPRVPVAVGIRHIVHREDERHFSGGQQNLLSLHSAVCHLIALVQIIEYIPALVELRQDLFELRLFREPGVVAAHRRFTVGEHHFGIDDQTVEEDVPYFALIGNERLRRRFGCRRRLRGGGGRRFRGRRGRRRREKDVERAAAAPGEERRAEQRREKEKYLSFHHALILSAAPEKVKARRFPNLGCAVLTML